MLGGDLASSLLTQKHANNWLRFPADAVSSDLIGSREEH